MHTHTPRSTHDTTTDDNDSAFTTSLRRQRRRLTLAFAMTTTIMIAQIVGVALTGSLALLTDTLHMLVDSSGLFMALIAAHLMGSRPSARRTWGMRRMEVLTALFQASLLLAAGAYAIIEGIGRLVSPPSVPSNELVVFGAIGLVCNVTSVFILAGGRAESMNLRAAFLEVLADTLGSVGVTVAAIVITTTGWEQADPVAGLCIAALIIPRAIHLLRETLHILMEYTPEGLDLEEIRRRILAVPHVTAVHDLHASTIASDLPTISAHVTLADQCFRDGHAPMVLARIHELLDHDFGVHHTTIQLEDPSAQRSESELHR